MMLALSLLAAGVQVPAHRATVPSTAPTAMTLDRMAAGLTALRTRAAPLRRRSGRGSAAAALSRIEANAAIALDRLEKVRALPAHAGDRGMAAARLEQAMDALADVASRLAASLDQLGLPHAPQSVGMLGEEADGERQQLIDDLKRFAAEARDEARRGGQEVRRAP